MALDSGEPPPQPPPLSLPLSAPHPTLSTSSTSSTSSPCPHNCIDEFNVGLFKGAFAGMLWGLYSLQRNFRHPPPPLPSPSPSSRASPLVLAALTSPRLRALSPVVVYPAKFAALVAFYHLWTCAGCHLSAPAPPSLLWTPVVAAGLSGLLVALPHLDARLAARTMVGCGLLGGVMGAGHLALHGWARGVRAEGHNGTNLSKRGR